MIRYFIFILFLTSNAFSQQKGYNNKTLWTVAWSPDGKYIATGGNQDELKLFDANTFELIKTYPVKGVQLSRLKWHPFQNKLAVITESKTFKEKILEDVYYSDFYSLPKYGKTKLGQYILHGKGGQNRLLIRKTAEIACPGIKRIISKHNIEAIFH